MVLHPTWQDIAIRLLLTMLASAVLGFNRGASGHAAGFRTTILVGLAASVAMIQANILLPVGGKLADSFGVMDLMRLPLGVLTGVGFIGGGTILKRGDLVTGVTTAATLWIVTIIGLCFGGGQLGLGLAATALGAITLWALTWIDVRIPRMHRAMLTLVTKSNVSPPVDLDNLIRPLGYSARFRGQTRGPEAQFSKLAFEIRWSRPDIAPPPFDLLQIVKQNYKIASFELTSETEH